MTIATLEIANFRNLQRLSLTLSSRLNLIVGENASGKTSLLEAVYYLGRARSFRTRQFRELIYHDSAAFRIVAKMVTDGRQVPIGIEHGNPQLTIRIDGVPARSLAELAVWVPVLLLNPDSHRLLDDGPQQRRRFMDWGLFHGEPGFLSSWQRFRTALRQRNAALRAGFDERTLTVWEAKLATAGEHLDALRAEFCQTLEQALRPLVKTLLDGASVAIEYRRGWSRDRELLELLRRDRKTDRQQGYTRQGPHRADFLVRFAGRSSSEVLSRGQQKLLVIALILAQAELYRRRQEKPCILLIDDLPAELDRTHRSRVMACLRRQELQLLITAIEAESLDTSNWADRQLFEIKQGIVSATA